ncbi:MAG: ABC transporter substrate-binding protein [Lachnospiraceae bacterium]|nr:ABC transporter substrate-binding protein [Lachnospiraceae bacterium]
MLITKKIIFTLLITFIGFFTACGVSDSNQAGKTILELAIFEDNPKVNEQVAIFNKNNDTYEITIKKYERSPFEPENDGILRLQREIMAGKGPDIIDYGRMYNTGDILGRYTENLSIWIDNSDAIQHGDFFTNILDSFAYRGGLYAMPVSFRLKTFAGVKEIIGERSFWTAEEMIACYEKYPDKILYPGQTKTAVLGRILAGSMGYYIDWENGTCYFNDDEFKKIMTFSDTFPANLSLDDDFSIKQTFIDGGALLYPLTVMNIFDISRTELIFGDSDISYIGFPVTGTNGTMIESSGPMLAISIASNHKEMAWKFILQFLSDDFQHSLDEDLPISRNVLEMKIANNKNPEYNGLGKPIAKSELIFEGEDPVNIYYITETQGSTLLYIIENARLNVSLDYMLYLLLLEEAESYLLGNKPLAEAVEIMQSRATIYVNEKLP